MRLALSALLTAIPLAAQVCEPSAEVQTALSRAGAGAAQRSAIATGVRSAFSADYFAHAFYQDAAGSPAPQAIRAEYRALRDRHPDSPVYQTLYARALIGADTRAAIPLLEAKPDFAPAWVVLARIHSSPMFYDETRLRADVAAYEKACPASLAIYDYARRIDDDAFSREHAPKLRRMLNGRTDPDAIRLYGFLWAMEFKSVPLKAQEPVRERVRQDAVRLRAMGAVNTLAMHALSHAYQILGDAEGEKWIAEHAPGSVPSAASDVNRVVNAWARANQPQTAAVPREYWQKQLLQSADWIRQWPNEPEPWQRRFEALYQLPESKPEDIAQAAGEWIRLHEQRGSDGYPPYPLYLSIARVYVDKGIHPEQVRSLIEKGVQEVLDAVDAPQSDLMPNQDPTGLIGLNSKWNTLGQAAQLDIQLRRYDQAHDMLSKLGASMEGKQAGVHEYRYWYAMAALARAENHLLDALTYERNAIAANTRDATVPAAYQEEYTARREKVRAERTAEAMEMWKSLGGSEKAFAEWLTPPAFTAPTAAAATTVTQADPWKTIGMALRDFSLTDAQGKTWRLADIKGKATLINLWATWCEPCRHELPYVQKLYNQLSGRGDMAVLTLNMDENTGLIEPFMKEYGYTFPVLPALDYVRALGLGLSLPRTWIVDTDGVLTQQRIGAGITDHWINDMITLLENARAHH